MNEQVQVTVSSSLKFKEHIRTTIEELKGYGVAAVFPNLDTNTKKEDVDLEFMKQLEKEHFQAIDSSIALYVICPEGYVGTLVSVEVGYAKAKRVKVIFSEQPEDLGLQALADQFIGLDELAHFQEIVEG